MLHIVECGLCFKFKNGRQGCCASISVSSKMMKRTQSPEKYINNDNTENNFHLEDFEKAVVAETDIN